MAVDYSVILQLAVLKLYSLHEPFISVELGKVSLMSTTGWAALL